MNMNKIRENITFTHLTLAATISNEIYNIRIYRVVGENQVFWVQILKLSGSCCDDYDIIF